MIFCILEIRAAWKGSENLIFIGEAKNMHHIYQLLILMLKCIRWPTCAYGFLLVVLKI